MSGLLPQTRLQDFTVREHVPGPSYVTASETRQIRRTSSHQHGLVVSTHASTWGHSRFPLFTKYIFSPSSPGWNTTSSPVEEAHSYSDNVTKSCVLSCLLVSNSPFVPSQLLEDLVFRKPGVALARSIVRSTVSQSLTRIGLISCLGRL